MAFALIFIIVLSVILLVGSVLIWKSTLPDNDKIVSIIAILGLFCLVSVINEAKKSSTDEIQYNLAEFEKSFYQVPDYPRTMEYKLPNFQEYDSNLQNALQNNENGDPQQIYFSVLFSPSRIGKSRAAKDFVVALQNKKQPALYLKIKNTNTDIFQFTTLLKISSLHVLDDAIDRLNKNGKTPTIIVDDFQNAFVKGQQGVGCAVCSHLKNIYQNKKVNIILITNDSGAKEAIKGSELFTSIAQFIDIQMKNTTAIESYIDAQINPMIKDDAKKFNPESISQFITKLGWDFSLVDRYVNSNQYSTVQAFIQSELESKSKVISNNPAVFDLVKCINLLSESNDYISYGVIKKACNSNPTSILDEAINAQILMKKDNFYKFRTNEYFYGAQLAKEPNKSEL